MTNAIHSGLPAQALPDTAPTIPTNSNGNGGNSVANMASTEAVTLSADAQTRTQLLDAARVADGTDTTAVAQARTAIQTNSYNVPPEDLAAAIASASKESQP